jgi:hypothetical protein
MGFFYVTFYSGLLQCTELAEHYIIYTAGPRPIQIL